MSDTQWIAVDWGTSNLRIWAMDAHGGVVDEITSDQGMLGLAPDAFEPILLHHINPWIGDAKIPVIACGMVGSRQGWKEAPYETVPARPATRTVQVETRDPRLNVHVVAGIQQTDPADVMRGEETQVAGFLTGRQGYSGVVCLPGTHSKWVEIERGEIKRFQTVLTGELFDLLSKQSVLRHSMMDWDEACFVNEVSQMVQEPEALTRRLFGVRANHLLQGNISGKSRLSGMLIGAELAALSSWWQGHETVVIGASALAQIYGVALRSLGANVQVQAGDASTLDGLKSVYRELFSCQKI